MNKTPLNNVEIVLFNPQIPQNTGNIGRLCVNTNTRLNIIKPIGFSLEEKYIKRAGMDYWKYVDLNIYKNWETFTSETNNGNFIFISTRGKKIYWDYPFYTKYLNNEKIFLIFGSETKGLTENIYNTYNDKLYKIPIYGKYSRSYNLSNSVAIVLFEAIKQIQIS